MYSSQSHHPQAAFILAAPSSIPSPSSLPLIPLAIRPSEQPQRPLPTTSGANAFINNDNDNSAELCGLFYQVGEWTQQLWILCERAAHHHGLLSAHDFAFFLQLGTLISQSIEHIQSSPTYSTTWPPHNSAPATPWANPPRPHEQPPQVQHHHQQQQHAQQDEDQMTSNNNKSTAVSKKRKISRANSKLPSSPSFSSPAKIGLESAVANPATRSSAKKRKTEPSTPSPSPALASAEGGEGAAAAAKPEKCCLDCKRTRPNQWRTGPHGPSSLCNACGMRYVRSQRKEQLRQQLLGTSNASNADAPAAATGAVVSTPTNNYSRSCHSNRTLRPLLTRSGSDSPTRGYESDHGLSPTSSPLPPSLSAITIALPATMPPSYGTSARRTTTSAVGKMNVHTLLN